ncbi:helix-turn-helix transcriptional regulator [Embleya sp. NPDC005575]|uniref:helix-turn-helix domain-containing protein n=1 Tax=Embleya sp. NPDC005575 TaxID=3156892 RepID=UPI0033A43725
MPKIDDRKPFPTELLATPAMIRACADRDLGAIFRLAQDDLGFTLSKLARLCEMTPSRVGDYVKGRAQVRQQHVIERVSQGLRIPGEMLGLAPQPWEENRAGDATGPAADPVRAIAVDHGESVPWDEPGESAHPFGDAVELSLKVDIEVGREGDVRSTYRLVVLNLTGRPLTRMVREMWFEHTRGRLTITPTDACDRQIAIQRLYDTTGLSKFACQISPPVPPGETTVIEYVCEGGLFVDSTYWRQAIARPTRDFSLSVTQHGVTEFRGCGAIEQHPDGSENSVTQHTRWSLDEDRLHVTLSRQDLHANQYVTLRWDVVHDSA